jgi:predicted PurR-regulated permease PerM
MDSARIEKFFFAGLLAVAVAFSYFILSPYLGPLVLAGALAIVFRPVYRWLLKVFRFPTLATFLTLAVVILVVFVPIGFFIPRILGEAAGLYASLAAHGSVDVGSALAHFLHTYFPNVSAPAFSVNIGDLARQALAWFTQNLGPFFSGVAQASFVVFLSLFGMFYFLKDGERLKQWVFEFVPLKRTYTEEIVHETEAMMSSVVKGTLVISAVQGVIVGAGLWIFGVSNPAFWGALTALASIIPIVGTWLVVVPAIAYLFLSGHVAAGIGFTIWSLILVSACYNFVGPQLMHRGVDIHPFIILLSVLGGIGAFGPIGLLVGPFIIAFLFALLRIYPKMAAEKESTKRNGKINS